ncbi:alpha/beta fold hydrolase [Rothia uropygialis]|uniref:alpha/beta fold hydrolase n=1 Tax=Kocuria sp. 36 TaxID=1415402 RepID=UPI00101B5CDB|nr:alpha/beta fold hydrolase [Kocuria sp. 36]
MSHPGTSPVPHSSGPTHRIGDLELTEHRFCVPLTHAWSWGHETEYSDVDHHGFDGLSIDLFARVVTHRGAESFGEPEARPYLVYLQGGPGMASPRPMTDSGWVRHMAKAYRVVLLDQRGTGLSTPISAGGLARLGSPEKQAAYLEHFRADSIVADAECVRATLTANESEKRWASLGQSFGGFITLTYLSYAPNSLLHSWMTAGLAPINSSPAETYRSTFDRVAERNAQYYEWYPEDRARGVRIASFLEAHDVRLASGERLTAHRFQMLGHHLGGNSRVHGLHYLLESAFSEGPERLSERFLTDVGNAVSFAGQPLYALMHEAIYCDGPGVSSDWSADRVRSSRPDYSEEADPLLFTGEMIHPWYFVEDPALSPVSEAAELLARKSDWGNLYDMDQFARNTVPVAASAYRHDVYVDFDHAMETASSVANLRTWTSNSMHHDALGHNTEEVLANLGRILVEEGALEESPVPFTDRKTV